MHEQNDSSPNMQQGLAIFSALTCSVTRTVHLLSRWPGSCGMWHFGFFLMVGFVIQLFYYQMNVEATGQFNPIVDWVLIIGTIGLAICHNLASWYYWFQGFRNHSWSPGVGILGRLMPESDPQFVAMASDLVVCLALAITCLFFGCTILANWYLYMIFWCLIDHALTSFGQRMQIQRLQDAQIEQQYWADAVENQRRRAEMQRERWGNRFH
ncbi:MAG: hypothetical protein R3E01_04205 [Pirellulaceae bacterium]